MRKQEINVKGLVLLFIGTVVTGALLSVMYLRLMPTVVEYSLYFGILLAVGFGAVAGTIAGLMVGFFKVTGYKQAMVAVILACIAFSYFKWALFLANDSEKAWFVYGTAVEYSDEFVSNTGVPLTEEQMLAVLEKMQKTSAFDYLDRDLQKFYEEAFDADELALMKATSYYTFFNYEEVFGTDINDALTGILNHSHYTYVLNFIENSHRYPDAVFYMLRPMEMFKLIGQINEEGRWNYDGRQIEGLFYMLAWIAEFLLICVPAIAVAGKKVRENEVTGFVQVQQKYNELNRRPGDTAPSTMQNNMSGIGGMGSVGGGGAMPAFHPALMPQPQVEEYEEEEPEEEYYEEEPQYEQTYAQQQAQAYDDQQRALELQQQQQAAYEQQQQQRQQQLAYEQQQQQLAYEQQQQQQQLAYEQQQQQAAYAQQQQQQAAYAQQQQQQAAYAQQQAAYAQQQSAYAQPEPPPYYTPEQQAMFTPEQQAYYAQQQAAYAQQQAYAQPQGYAQSQGYAQPLPGDDDRRSTW
jgi:hypothetical protein